MRTAILFLLATCVIGCQRQPERQTAQRYPQPYPERFIPPQPHVPVRPLEPQWKTKNFRGEWRTTGRRKLKGIMDCTITRIGPERYTGRFWGVWQGVDFNYTVQFSGPLGNLVGDPCTIDGASYQWKGSVFQGMFEGSYTGSRYTGWFKLRER